MVHRREVKLYFFWIVITRGTCWFGFWQHWSNFWIWPLYKLSYDPQASCTGCDLAAIWNGDPWTHTNIMKLSNLMFLSSWVNFGSIRPKLIILGWWLFTLDSWQLCLSPAVLKKSANISCSQQFFTETTYHYINPTPNQCCEDKMTHHSLKKSYDSCRVLYFKNSHH